MKIIGFACILGTVLAVPLQPLSVDWNNWNFYPAPYQGNQFYYLIQKPYNPLISRSEVKFPLTANLLCANIPLRQSPGSPSDFNDAAQQAAEQAQQAGQAIADQIQAGASSVSSQIQDAIANSQSQIQDALGGASSAFDQLIPGNPPMPMQSGQKEMMKPMIKGQPIEIPFPELENRFIALEQPAIINLPRLTPLRIRSVGKDVKETPKIQDKSVPVVKKA